MLISRRTPSCSPPWPPDGCSGSLVLCGLASPASVHPHLSIWPFSPPSSERDHRPCRLGAKPLCVTKTLPVPEINNFAQFPKSQDLLWLWCMFNFARLPPRAGRPCDCSQRAASEAFPFLYISYDHEDRTHLGLGKGTPGSRTRCGSSGRVFSYDRLGGLHHRYDRAAEGDGLSVHFIYICIYICAPLRRKRHGSPVARPEGTVCTIEKQLVGSKFRLGRETIPPLSADDILARHSAPHLLYQWSLEFLSVNSPIRLILCGFRAPIDVLVFSVVRLWSSANAVGVRSANALCDRS